MCVRAVARSRHRKSPTSVISLEGNGDGDALAETDGLACGEDEGLRLVLGLAAGVGRLLGPEVVAAMGGLVDGGADASIAGPVAAGFAGGVGDWVAWEVGPGVPEARPVETT